MRCRALLFFSLLSLIVARAGEPVPLPAAGGLLFAAASDAELQPLRAKLSDVRTENSGAWEFWIGQAGGHSVILTRTDGDPLNAVAATTLAIRHYRPALVVTFGAARAHDPALKPGDVVVSGKFSAEDGMYSPVTPLGGGSHDEKWKNLPHLLMTPGERETPALDFPADPAALAVAQKLSLDRGRLVVGVLGSAGQVNREADRVAWLRSHWGTSCEDGESAHIAGCALLLGVPVIGLRVIDGSDDDAAVLAIKFLEAWK